MSPSQPRRARGGRAIAGVVAGALGLAAAGRAVDVAVKRRQRVVARRGVGDAVAFGSLRAPARTVVAEDGVPLYVEVDEFDGPTASGRHTGEHPDPGLTVVFVHGYALELDCWHFQRAGYRGLVRTVYYDQRSHGRSGRSTKERSTIDQLGRDLAQIIDEIVPDGPVVLVGHSMGGMTILTLAQQRPELFGSKVVGVALIATTAGGLDPARVLLPWVPVRLTSQLTDRTVAALGVGHLTVDGVRRAGRSVASVLTDRFAFGGSVPPEYRRFVDDMLSETPFITVADFFASFRNLDVWQGVEVLASVPVSIICGTGDKITAIGHSRKLQSRIRGSRLLECPGAGHMVTLECHERVNAEIDHLLAAAGDLAARLEASGPTTRTEDPR